MGGRISQSQSHQRQSDFCDEIRGLKLRGALQRVNIYKGLGQKHLGESD